MARSASMVSRAVAARMQAEAGLPYSVAAIGERERVPLPPIDAAHIYCRNVSPEVTERSVGGKYPAFYIFCEKIHNELRERFRTFSGTATVAIDVRVSRDRIEGVEEQLQYYVEAVTEVLDNNRGTWPDGMFYAGGYEVTFGALKHGGKNFLQSARVRFAVNISSE